MLDHVFLQQQSLQHTLSCTLCKKPFLLQVHHLQVADGDMIRIDAEKRSMDVLDLDDAEWERRRAAFKPLPLKAAQGTLYKYIKAVSSASLGCVTDL